MTCIHFIPKHHLNTTDKLVIMLISTALITFTNSWFPLWDAPVVQSTLHASGYFLIFERSISDAIEVLKEPTCFIWKLTSVKDSRERYLGCQFEIVLTTTPKKHCGPATYSLKRICHYQNCGDSRFTQTLSFSLQTNDILTVSLSNRSSPSCFLFINRLRFLNTCQKEEQIVQSCKFFELSTCICRHVRCTRLCRIQRWYFHIQLELSSYSCVTCMLYSLKKIFLKRLNPLFLNNQRSKSS